MSEQFPCSAVSVQLAEHSNISIPCLFFTGEGKRDSYWILWGLTWACPTPVQLETSTVCFSCSEPIPLYPFTAVSFCILCEQSFWCRSDFTGFSLSLLVLKSTRCCHKQAKLRTLCPENICSNKPQLCVASQLNKEGACGYPENGTSPVTCSLGVFIEASGARSVGICKRKCVSKHQK